MLNMTKVKIEFTSDPEMYIFFEKGMRGGVSYISNRYSKANNKYLKSYDPKQESKHIIYLDANKCFPTSGFKSIDPKEFDLNKYTSNGSNGYVLEADLVYSKVLRELHKDYLLAPDKIEIKREILSKYQLKNADHYNIPIGNVKKLVPNFFDKEKYVNNYKNLKLCVRLGLKIKKRHVAH